MGCECGGCQRGAEAVPVILRCCSPPGFGCVFAGTGVKTVSPNGNHSWWGGEPHNTPIGETKNFYPEIYPHCLSNKTIHFLPTFGASRSGEFLFNQRVILFTKAITPFPEHPPLLHTPLNRRADIQGLHTDGRWF